jgi:DNA-directed RNA polymerase I and III subunit RPAC1
MSKMSVVNEISPFHQQFQIKINRLSDLEMEFDLIGVDASIANAFRRILLAEVQ